MIFKRCRRKSGLSLIHYCRGQFSCWFPFHVKHFSFVWGEDALPEEVENNSQQKIFVIVYATLSNLIRLIFRQFNCIIKPCLQFSLINFGLVSFGGSTFTGIYVASVYKWVKGELTKILSVLHHFCLQKYYSSTKKTHLVFMYFFSFRKNVRVHTLSFI